jgi:hypothetical protein
MTKKTQVAALIVSALIVAGAFAIAWQYWPPLLKYREQRLADAYSSQIRRYLKGSDSLDVAAHRLAQTIVKIGFLMERQQSQDPAPGEGSLVAVTAMKTPSDIPSDDPRVEELVLNAFKFANPPGVSEEFKTRSAGMWDSIIQSRGYRSVP